MTQAVQWDSDGQAGAEPAAAAVSMAQLPSPGAEPAAVIAEISNATYPVHATMETSCLTTEHFH
jgi:hypothetical protein